MDFATTTGLLLAALLTASSPVHAHDRKYSAGLRGLVVGEVDALRRQIVRCWNVPAVTKSKNFEVHVRVGFRGDGTVGTARVVDTAFILNDPYRFSVAKSARDALLSRRCNPLAIPKDHRRSGDRIILILNPSVIFRRR